MFSGLKFIPRDQIDEAKDGSLDGSRKDRRKSSHRHEKDRRKNKHSHYSSSDDEELEKIKSGSRKKKKWYDSDEDLSPYSENCNSESESEKDRKKHKGRSKKKAKSKRKDYSSDDEHLDKSSDIWKQSSDLIDDVGVSQSQNNLARKEMGLEWMFLRPTENVVKTDSHVQAEEATAEEIKKENPRELNPYFKDDGSGYPEESDARGKQILSSSVVGDGGSSWRLKALKRAQEQAAREGRKLQEVVEERWGSMGQFAASVASQKVAPTHAHLHAIKNRRRGFIKEEHKNIEGKTDRSTQKDSDKKSDEEILPRNPKMRVPKVDDSLSWGKRGYTNLSTQDSALVSSAMSGLNKFSDDGSFLEKIMPQKNPNSGGPSNSSVTFSQEDAVTDKPSMSANQLAAKALQLKMKGKHEEADKLLKEVEKMKAKQNSGDESSRLPISGATSRLIIHDVSTRKRNKEEDADLHLAQKIFHNHKYNVDEEYDYDDGPRRKTRKKVVLGDDRKSSSEITNSAKRFFTPHDRCQYCFDNPTRPKHLVIAIGNFTYLSLPQTQPVVPGHCYILTLQHESSTRSVDDDAWTEIRNFKKCLIMMFAKQEKDVIFLETVIGLAQQRRHCLVDCIPLPREIAKQAPVYFKKAIDEAEDEWSQHNAKKLIDTSEKGLRHSIPNNFPYFHVEFGLNKGFVHVIDDEKDFKTSFGLNIIRGMLQLPAEDMHRKRRIEAMETQKKDVENFSRDWKHFDWTKQLE